MRNAAKHANALVEVNFNEDPEFALQMIMRAMPMARSLGLFIARETEMVNFIRHFSKNGFLDG